MWLRRWSLLATFVGSRSALVFAAVSFVLVVGLRSVLVVSRSGGCVRPQCWFASRLVLFSTFRFGGGRSARARWFRFVGSAPRAGRPETKSGELAP